MSKLWLALEAGLITLRNLYLRIRELVRRTIINTPSLDRWLGDPLRKLERVLRPYNYLLHQDDGQIEIHNITLQYRKTDAGVIQIIQLTGDYEPETTRYIVDQLKPGDSFVDLGAHIGYMTLVAARAVGPTGRVYAFEPSQETYLQLQRNIQLNGLADRVISVPNAVSDRNQTIKFFVSSENSVSAHIETSNQMSDIEQMIEVEAVSLDEYFANLGWPALNIIKMDVEGAELSTLRGMHAVSLRNPYLKLIAEVNYPHLRQLAISGEEFVRAFQDLGFRRFRILRSGYDRPLTMPNDLDYLFSVASRYTVNVVCEK